MIRNESFYIKEIEGKKYIIPYGQMVANMARGICINETGAFIWKLLENDISRDELLKNCFEHFEASESEYKIIENDVLSFLKILNAYDMIREKGIRISSKNLLKRVSIAGIKVGFYGADDCLRDDFDDFEIKNDKNTDEKSKDDLIIEFSHEEVPIYENGRMIVKDAVVNTMECEDRFVLTFSQSDEIEECHLSRDGSVAVFYTQTELSEYSKEVLFHAIRTVFLYRALQNGIIAVHSVSVLYNNQAWLFSASSGTGKSTHADLWKKLFNVGVLNGDLNLAGFSEGKAYVYGLPWCGTSGIYSNSKHELGGIVLLKRDDKNFIEELSEDKKRLLIQQRIISPSWSPQLIDRQFDIIENIMGSAKTFRLHCTKDDEAAVTVKEYIDSESNK